MTLNQVDVDEDEEEGDHQDNDNDIKLAFRMEVPLPSGVVEPSVLRVNANSVASPNWVMG